MSKKLITRKDFIVDPVKLPDYILSCKRHLSGKKDGVTACMNTLCEDCPFDPKLSIKRKKINCAKMVEVENLHDASEIFLNLYDPQIAEEE